MGFIYLRPSGENFFFVVWGTDLTAYLTWAISTSLWKILTLKHSLRMFEDGIF